MQDGVINGGPDNSAYVMWRQLRELDQSKGPPMPSSDKGLYNKYQCSRTDGKDQPGGPKEGAVYFPLDIHHDIYARRAAAFYADCVEDRHPKLARELRQLIARHGGIPLPGAGGDGVGAMPRGV